MICNTGAITLAQRLIVCDQCQEPLQDLASPIIIEYHGLKNQDHVLMGKQSNLAVVYSIDPQL